MAWEDGMQVLSWPAAGDLSSFQYYPVTLTTNATFPDGCITTISATATKPLGVLQDAPDAAGVMGAVCVAGVSKILAYTGAIALLDSLGVDTSGRAAVTTTDNQWIVGTVYDGKTADAGVNTYITAKISVERY
jgi:hypothetical protein